MRRASAAVRDFNVGAGSLNGYSQRAMLVCPNGGRFRQVIDRFGVHPSRRRWTTSTISIQRRVPRMPSIAPAAAPLPIRSAGSGSQQRSAPGLYASPASS